ncbi:MULTISPECIES: hypothetical protein [Clostridium]|uniref:Uncharacterized protein n=1 Tax=Clostridium sporogenes TaxID=1509 RepID=A0A1J1CT17_CLOSG|nr:MULTISPECIES: hypothetical protein [Clostridium]APF25122.1 hypothetical protein NPD7_3848 [Clostridium sporogenes]APH16920.1 hypothetical protein NPD5_3944 [Clostridium sporogenes]MBD5639444.1 hypothetical protein [Clostridium botulinum]MDI6919010.1 hypothetical protein [Clostridium botulinum]WMU99772.1 hypothetical protein QA656_19255 [Clostridium botulinum]
MNKYRVEFRKSSKDYSRKDCSENQLEETKKLIKSIKNQEGTDNSKICADRYANNTMLSYEEKIELSWMNL